MVMVWYGWGLILLYLQNFAANVTQAAELTGKINVQVKKPDDTIEAGAQVQQMINAECVDDYPGKDIQNGVYCASKFVQV